MKRQQNNKNISKITTFEFLQPKKSVESTTIIRRMIDILIGREGILAMNTRSHLLIFYSVFAITATGWWYFLKQLDRYRIETMLEQGLYEYNHKGKVVATEEFKEAIADKVMVTRVRNLLVKKKVEQLEKDICQFKEEKELMREILDNQKRIEIKLQSLEDKLNSRN
ncbi:hypothetical protein LOD99_1231 [Oopsacas minuta]|uniref:Uncharacterized protein n=1 Tax=Oopsacas minuta TaxID=111878 RepID=A0AAV7K6D7_9METZ|nr:hypothetical protein LOD99_1231 [Oopsacas minuta]